MLGGAVLCFCVSIRVLIKPPKKNNKISLLMSNCKSKLYIMAVTVGIDPA